MKRFVQKFMSVGVISLVIITTLMAPFSLSLGVDGIDLSTQTAYAQEDPIGDTLDAEMFTCSFDSFSMFSCTVAFLETILRIVHVMVAWSGIFADIALDLSISSDTYSANAEFVTVGWTIVRDLANIFFILALLIIAIGTILRVQSINAKKLLPTLIIIALVINFSLFVTKIIIDGGNILSRAFINNMSITVSTPDGQPEETDYVQFSQVVVQQMRPTELLAIAANQTLYGNKSIILPYMLGIIIAYGFIIYVFVSIAFLFVARFIGLWFLMILAPIAFVSHALPFNLPQQFDHRRWWKELANLSFQPAIFLFFMYILLRFLDAGGFISSVFATANNVSFSQQMLLSVLPVVVISAFMLMALKTAVKMGGELGELVHKAGGAVAGAVVGGGVAAATGGTAFLGRQTVGRLGSKMTQIKGGGALGRIARSTGKSLESSSFDARNTSFTKDLMNRANMNALGVGNLGMQTKGLSGTKETYQQDWNKEVEERIKNETATEKSNLQTTETREKLFKANFGDIEKGLQKSIDKLRQEKNDAEDPKEKEALAKNIKDAIKNKENFEQGKDFKHPETGATHDAVKLEQKDKDGTTREYSLKDIQKTKEYHQSNITRREVEVRGKTADEMSNQFYATTGLTESERTEFANKVRGGSGVDSSKLKDIDYKPEDSKSADE